MTIGKEIEKRGHITGFREEIKKAAKLSDDTFFTWFDSAKNMNAAFIRGSWDFMMHIAQPSAIFLKNPEECVALEIGYGGGRLSAAASRCFRKIIGIDIHDQSQKVGQVLRDRGIENFELLTTDGNEIPVNDDTIDFVYSFIVLQHVEKYEVFIKYLSEVHRVLKLNGIAVIYFGRPYLFSINRSSKILYYIDKIVERIRMPRGFKEIAAQVNCTNLIVSMPHAKATAKKYGFKVLKELVSHKKVPDGIRLFGGQYGLILEKINV